MLRRGARGTKPARRRGRVALAAGAGPSRGVPELPGDGGALGAGGTQNVREHLSERSQRLSRRVLKTSVFIGHHSPLGKGIRPLGSIVCLMP